VGGQKFPVHPNYGKETVMGGLETAAVSWECNNDPKIKVPDNSNEKVLRALTRRTRVVDYFSTYDPDRAVVDIPQKIFLDDPDLAKLMTSELGRCLYMHDFMASCGHILK
jgi:hypothetical protein